MRPTRATLALLLAFGLCLSTGRAEAQSTNQNPELLAILLAPPAVASLICDIVTVATLTNGFAYRGSTITGTVLGGITTLFSFLALAIGLSSPGLFNLWIPAGSVGIALGLGSVLVGLYGIANPPPERPPEKRLDLGGVDHGVSGTRASGEVRFLPSVWADKRGMGAMGSLSVAL